MHRASLLFFLAAVGCGDGGDNTGDTSADPTGTATGTTGTSNVYSSDWDGVEALILAECVLCHGPGGSAEFLPFPQSIVDDVNAGTGFLVVPGDPDNSLLWIVLEGSGMSFMPPGSAPLPANEVAHVYEWIEAGAAVPSSGTTGTTTSPTGTTSSTSGTTTGGTTSTGTGTSTGATSPTTATTPSTSTTTAPPTTGTSPSSTTGTGSTPTSTTSTATALSHAADIQPIWNLHCTSGCHSGPFASDGIDLSAGSAYGELVGVTSNDVPAMPRVDPTDPSNSYLWHKLENTHLSVGGAGASMPKFAPLLPPSDTSVIEQWILDGALP